MITQVSQRKISIAIVLAALLKEPFVCIYSLFAFILLKDFGALPFQIVLLKMLKPSVSLVSFYVNGFVARNTITLRSFILFCGFFSRICFIPALLSDNIYHYIFGSTIYMVFSRVEVSAWMEVIKKNVFRKSWESSFSYGSVVSYTSGVIFTFFSFYFIDSYFLAWKVLFIISLGLGFLATIIQVLLIENDQEVIELKDQQSCNFLDLIKQSVSLLKTNKEFRRFQWAFMIGGLGLMIIQPVIPIYLTEIYSIKYSDMLVALCVCKSCGFVFSTPLWNNFIKLLPTKIYIFFVLLGFSLFSIMFSVCSINFYYVYIAYVVYGIAQAGSHLIWHLSGPLFSKEESSSMYTGVSIIMVGFRGLIGPLLGMIFMFIFSPGYIFSFCSLLIILGAIYYVRDGVAWRGFIKA